ncbi:MAG: alginate lyase family protein, partial [Xanthomonadales bacterium]|nr:alginate lyase family protein [Xanthomonadales bacterium]
GNHLFANAKALVFAGCYFEGSEVTRWLGTGLRILARELPEQVLPDGGQFELSPMYHALAFEDLLDLVNLADAFPGRIDTAVVDSWRQTAIRMWRWLRVMTHPDGELAFFNDTAIGVAPSNGELEAYALRLGIEAPEGEPFERSGTSGQGDGGASLDTLRTGGQGGGEATFGGLRTGGDGAGSVEDADPGAGLIHLPGSGYLRLSHGPATLFLDCARIGPDYLPGHAHADQLSFELSIGARRVLVNTGIDRYGTDAERVRQRGTAAHNCVVVDGQDSAEVWSGFRVARRGYPLDLVATKSEASLEVACSHTGYRRLPGRVVHRRRWRLEAGQLLIEDRLSGRFGQAEAWFHLHPDIVVKLDDPRKARISLPDGRLIGLSIEGGSARLQPSQWRPGFGRSLDTQVVVVALNDTGLTTIWRW